MEGLTNEVAIVSGILSLSLIYLIQHLYHYLKAIPEEQAVRIGPIQRYSDCPICLQPINNRIMATCSHDFCASCIIDYWHTYPHSSSLLSGINCPICRSIIDMFYIDCISSPANHSLLQQIKTYNNLYSNAPSSLYQQLTRLPTMIQRTIQYVLTTQQGRLFLFTTLTSTSRCLFIFLYLLSPFDLLPEALFGLIGLLDDLFLFLALLVYISQTFYTQHLQRQP